MARGRPPQRKLDPDRPQLTVQRVVRLAQRGRISIPREVADGLSWLHRRQAVRSLGVFNEPGCLVLHAWESESPSVLARQAQLSDEVNLEGLRLLQDRYRLINIAADLRITLTLDDVTHLGLSYVCKRLTNRILPA